MIKLYTFDVFDTLVTRSVATPRGVFALMHAQMPVLLRSRTPSFFQVRTNAEIIARRDNKTPEVTSDQIYKIIGAHYGLYTDEINQLINLEQEIERAVSVPVQNNIIRVKKLLQQGKNVAFISDFYSSKEFIIGLLSPHFTTEEFSKLNLYVSSERMATKKDGDLYHIVAKENGVAFHEMHHMGDNAHSDIAAPKSLGIKTTIFEESLANKRELDCVIEESCTSQILFGCAKLLRLKNGDDNNIFTSISGCIAGPLFYSYLKWILCNAEKEKLRKLFFLARDGQILLKLIKDFPGLLPTNIPLDYLYVSRRALDGVIQNDGQRELFKQYLNQLNFTSQGHVGIVDIGWTGRMHDKFFSLIEDYPATELTGYYLGMYSVAKSERSHKKGFVYDITQDDAHKRKIECNANLLECLLSADHGSTYEYTKEGDKAAPVLKNFECETENWDLKLYRETLIDYYSILSQYSNFLPPFPDLSESQEIGQKIIASIAKPDKEIIYAVANYQLNSSAENNVFAPLARKITLRDLLYLTPANYNAFSSWQDATEIITSPIIYFMWRIKRKVWNMIYMKK